ncbi:hypothetical protein U3516DRAFT_826910 [Neocallimastix sp. 'constans']|jgi:hypothetical protein
MTIKEKDSIIESIYHKKWHPKMVHRKRKSSQPVRAIDTSNCMSETEKCIEGIVKIEIYPIMQTHPNYLVNTPKEAEHLSLETPLKLVTSRRHKYHNLPHCNSQSSLLSTSSSISSTSSTSYYNYFKTRLNSPPPKMYPLSQVISKNYRQLPDRDTTPHSYSPHPTITTSKKSNTNSNNNNGNGNNSSNNGNSGSGNNNSHSNNKNNKSKSSSSSKSKSKSSSSSSSGSKSKTTVQHVVVSIGNKNDIPDYETYKKMQYINPPPPMIWNKSTPLEIPPDTPFYDLLQKEEIHTCSKLRILPAQYLRIRDILIKGYKKNGYYLKKDAKKWCRGIDVNKTGKLYDWWVDIGWLPFKEIIEAEQLEKERKRTQRKK